MGFGQTNHSRLKSLGEKPMSYDYDLLVIGAGSGGVRCSRMAAQMGAKVAVIEDLYLGGTCVNVGCVPKKLFVFASEYSQNFKDAKGFGWDVSPSGFDWAQLRDNKTSEIERLNGVYDSILGGANVEIIHGRGKVAGPNQVEVDGTVYTAERILIATGGWPNAPSFPGAEHTFNSNEVFYLDALPKRVIVQGGGYIAIEFAGIFNGLGCETELVYRGPLFLRNFDHEVSEFIRDELIEKGIKLSFDTDIRSITKQESGSLSVEFNTGETREVDGVFTAIGRKPKTQNLGLENTKVELAENGSILVNENFQTAEPSIYALGDVVGRMELTPVALAEGMALASHLYSDKPISLDYENIATAIFSQPNIGTVGLSEEKAREKGYDVSIFTSSFRAMKNTLSGNQEKTFMKIVVDKDSDQVLGVHMVGESAGEIIQGIAIAVKMGAKKSDFDATIGIHPTAAEEFVTMRNPTR